MNITKIELLDMLVHGIVSVKFIKANGDERKMKCTLNDKYIREDAKPKDTNKVTTLQENLVRVYDVENEGWRTININTLIQF